ncbi:hypothetical protein [Arthrobacter sp. 31Y]|uniref:hypothetical protein n=1 Tax=Arthrobacter sp. 31Y TaxID=1115632 RepID=UPI00163B0526|nr:hypothetical protein [Arthrobacter sp. 31Y]
MEILSSGLEEGLVMMLGAVSAMYLLKEVLPLCRLIQRSGGQSAVAFWVVLPIGGGHALDVGASSGLR